MARPQTPRPDEAANVGAESVPPGATREALNREHMPDSPGPEDTESDEARDDATGPTAGTVVSDAEGSKVPLGSTGHGIRPGTTPRGDSTVGADPDRPTE